MERASVYGTNDFTNEITIFSVEKVVYTPKSRISSIPLENGRAVFDNRVIDPAEVSVTVKFVRDSNPTARTTGASFIQAMMAKEGRLYSITDGMGLAINGLILKSAPYTRTPEQFDIALIELIFERPIIVDNGGNPTNSDNSNSVGLGYAHGVQK